MRAFLKPLLFAALVASTTGLASAAPGDDSSVVLPSLDDAFGTPASTAPGRVAASGQRTVPTQGAADSVQSANSSQNAAPNPQALLDARAACEGDVNTLCAGVQPGGGRILACLWHNRRKVSKSCRQGLLQAGIQQAANSVK